MEHNSHDQKRPDIRQPESEQQEVELPDLSGGQVIFDTNLFISERNRIDSFMRDIGNPKVYHTVVNVIELRRYLKRLGKSRWEIAEQIFRLLRAFKSTPLPKTRKTWKIVRRISRYLKLAGVLRKTVRQEKNDATIAAYGMLYGIDVLTADVLFYVMGKVFAMGIEIHLTWKKKPEHRIAQTKAILEKKGTKTPVDLTHLLDRTKSKKRHTPKGG